MKNDLSSIDLKITSALEKLAHIQRVLLWEVGKKENLSPIQIQFLGYLSRYPEELRHVSALATEFDLTKATVSEALRVLEEKGLVTRIQKEEDRRSYVLDLTPDGRRLAKKVEGWKDALAGAIHGLGHKGAALMFLMELIKALSESGSIHVARLCIACENMRPVPGGGYYCGLTEQKMKTEDLNIGCEFYKSHKAV